MYCLRLMHSGGLLYPPLKRALVAAADSEVEKEELISVWSVLHQPVGRGGGIG